MYSILTLVYNISSQRGCWYHTIFPGSSNSCHRTTKNKVKNTIKIKKDNQSARGEMVVFFFFFYLLYQKKSEIWLGDLLRVLAFIFSKAKWFMFWLWLPNLAFFLWHRFNFFGIFSLSFCASFNFFFYKKVSIVYTKLQGRFRSKLFK